MRIDSVRAHRYHPCKARRSDHSNMQITKHIYATHIEEDPDSFTRLISDAFKPIVDFDRIAKNVMGKYSKAASIDQMQAFSLVFENSLLETYSSTLVEFKDEKINVLSPTKPQQSKTKARVSQKNKIEDGLFY